MLCLRAVEGDRKVDAIGLFRNIVLRDETIANLLQALAEDKTSASLLKSVSWRTKPSQLFAYALLLNDTSARFFEMFGNRGENTFWSHFWSQGGTPRHP